MGKHSKPAEFRVNGKVNLAKSTDVSAGVHIKVHLSKTDISECVNGSESTGIDVVDVGFVCFVGILILLVWSLLGDWLSTLLGEETGLKLATLISDIFIVLISSIVVAIKET